MPTNVLPLDKVIEQLKNASIPGVVGGVEYILQNYNINPRLFTYWYNKCENSSKKRGFGKSNNSLWIAANCVSTIIDYPHAYYCYYCMIDFNFDINNNKPEFEHFTPQLQEPGNIVFACSFCNRLKKDMLPADFWNQLNNNKVLKGLQPVNKHFAPLVIRHAPSSSEHDWKVLDWLSFMKLFAKEDFGVEIQSVQPYTITVEYCTLFRNRYQNNPLAKYIGAISSDDGDSIISSITKSKENQLEVGIRDLPEELNF